MLFFRRTVQDAGSSIIEFVLLAPIMFFVALATTLVGVTSFGTLMVRSAVIEAAAWGALADQNDVSACAKLDSLIAANFRAVFKLSSNCSMLTNGRSIRVTAVMAPGWSFIGVAGKPIAITSVAEHELVRLD